MNTMFDGFNIDYTRLVSDERIVLEYLLNNSDQFAVIADLRKPYTKTPSSFRQDEGINPLLPYLISQENGIREWPGTRTRDCHKARLIFRICRESKNALLKLSGLFSAVQNNMPEDVCFYRNTVLWFCTTSHERDASVQPLTERDQAFFEQYRTSKRS